MKNYLKMNNECDQYSLGNFIKLIKNNSKNKNNALQSDIFCTIFNIDSINDTTVNNYCIGIRAIHGNYKQIYLNFQKKLQKDPNVLFDIIINLYYIITGNISNIKSIEKCISFINNNDTISIFCNQLYNIAKNDYTVNLNFLTCLNFHLQSRNFYKFIECTLFYIILDKQQPVYKADFNNSVINNILQNTKIPSKDLEKYLNLKLLEGINYNFKLQQLVKEKNAFAAYELGINEYKGYTTGVPRYEKSIEYFTIASEQDHPSALYMIANIYINKIDSNEYNKLALILLEKSISLGNIAALNLKGKMYLYGIFPLDKNADKATKLFNEAIKYDYVFAYNNLGKIYENNDNLEKAYELYYKSANLKESWASNKVGLYYLKKSDYKNAFQFFNYSIEYESNLVSSYAYYNLAKYFYFFGNESLKIKANKKLGLDYINKAIKLNNLDAMIFLLLILSKDYFLLKKEEILINIMELINKIELHNNYTISTKNIVEDILKNIKSKPNIDLSIFDL